MNPYASESVWIVGGTQGIGLALAEQLSRQGAQLTLLARNRDRLAQEAARLGCQQRSLDVGDADQVEEVLGDLLAQQGPPGLFCNTAGLALPGYLEDLSVVDLDLMNRVNYLGTAYCCRMVAPAMVRQGRGQILNTSSLAGLFGLYGYTGYCASKFAVVGFCEALRRELQGSGVGVSCLCPPNTRTPGLEQENLRKPPEVLAQEEKAAVLEPADVARYTLARLPSNPRWIIPSLDGRLAHQLARWAPWALDWILRRPRAR